MPMLNLMCDMYCRMCTEARFIRQGLSCLSSRQIHYCSLVDQSVVQQECRSLLDRSRDLCCVYPYLMSPSVVLRIDQIIKCSSRLGTCACTSCADVCTAE